MFKRPLYAGIINELQIADFEQFAFSVFSDVYTSSIDLTWFIRDTNPKSLHLILKCGKFRLEMANYTLCLTL